MFEFAFHFRFASLLYQLYHSFITSVIWLEPPWSGVQIPAAPPNKIYMSSDVVLLGGSYLVISPFSDCYINHEVTMLYQILSNRMNSGLNYLIKGGGSWPILDILI